MSTSVSTAFIRQFESDVHVAYQRMGTKLRNTIRRKVAVQGEDVRFQKYGKGTASTKSRHGDVPLMNVSHNTVDCAMSDHYAAEYIDELDMLKTNIEEKNLAAQAGAAALGRKTDSLITTAMDTTTTTIAHGSAGLTKAKVHSAFETLGNNDVPDDNQPKINKLTRLYSYVNSSVQPFIPNKRTPTQKPTHIGQEKRSPNQPVVGRTLSKILP